MNDHHHYGEYAESRHDHRGEYADERHDHDLDYAERHHRHYDDERAVEELRGQVRELRAIMIEFGLDLSEAQGRIHALEGQTPDARQAEYEADVALADAAASQADDDRCPDCGRASCTGEDCYWPDGAGIARPEDYERGQS